MILPSKAVHLKGQPGKSKFCDTTSIAPSQHQKTPKKIAIKISPELAAFLAEKPASPAPDSSLIRLLQRADDAYASFHFMQGNEFKNLASVPTDEIVGHSPALYPYLQNDSYFSINSFFRGGWPMMSEYLKGSYAAHRDMDDLRWLNACFLDLDCYRLGRKPKSVVLEILRMETEGLIPPVSIFALSGRGVWLFWILRDPEDSTKPQRAWPEKVRFYVAIQNAIHRVLSRLVADAHDAARITRVPGSVNGKSGRVVKWWVRPGGDHAPFSYTLDELASVFHPKQPRVRSIGPQGGKGKRIPKRRRGRIAMRRNRRRQFFALWRMRNGFHEGCRNYAALIYASILYLYCAKGKALRDKLYQFGDSCKGPLSHNECDKALAGGEYKFTDQKIANWLEITPEESAKLTGWPAAIRFGPGQPVKAKPSRCDRAAARRKLIVDLIGTGPVPSIRTMISLLKQNGHQASEGTVHNDYSQLGLRSEVAKLSGKAKPALASDQVLKSA